MALIDDWIETGSQLRAVHDLLADCGATLVGYSVIIDDLSDTRRTSLVEGHAILRSTDLPPATP